MNFIKNIYYRFKTTFFYASSINYALDAVLKKCVEKGVKDVKAIDSYYQKVVFKDGTVYTFWNRNKYTLWLSDGEFTFPNGNSFNYTDSRPTVKTIYEFEQALSKCEFF